VATTNCVNVSLSGQSGTGGGGAGTTGGRGGDGGPSFCMIEWW